jgi:hypothetical protein
MTIAHLLEEFAGEEDTGGLRLISDLALEEERLAAFDDGFAAGWDDALKAQKQTETRINEAFADALETAGFTYHEALSQITENLSPVFEQLVAMVLPEVLQTTLGLHVIDRLTELATDAAAQPITVTVSPAFRPRLEALVAQQSAVSVDIRESADHDTVTFAVGSMEQELNMGRLLDDIKVAVDAYVHTGKRIAANG